MRRRAQLQLVAAIRGPDLAVVLIFGDPARQLLRLPDRSRPSVGAYPNQSSRKWVAVAPAAGPKPWRR